MQHVRRPGAGSAALAVQRRALAHAEAVLLVHDRPRASARSDVRSSISACVPTTSEQLPAGQPCEDVRAPTARGVEPVSSAGRASRLRPSSRCKRREMLLGERLRRRHQRRLAAVLDGPQHRVQRDHRLARADLPHQQPLHRASLARGPRRSPRSRRAGRRSARNGSVARASARRARRAADTPAPARPPGAAALAQQDAAAAQQQLLEGQAPRAPRAPRGRRPGSAAPTAPPRARAGARARAPSAGSVSGRRPGQGAGRAHERLDLRRADALGGGVAATTRALLVRERRARPARGRRRAKRASGLRPCLQHQARARRVALEQPGLVEERRAQRRRSRRRPAPPPGAAPRRRLGAPGDRAHLTAIAACSPGAAPRTARACAVIARQVREQVADVCRPSLPRRLPVLPGPA